MMIELNAVYMYVHTGVDQTQCCVRTHLLCGFLNAVFVHTVSVVFCSILLFACEQIRQVIMEGFGAAGVMDLESKLRPNRDEVRFFVVCVVLC